MGKRADGVDMSELIEPRKRVSKKSNSLRCVRTFKNASMIAWSSLGVVLRQPALRPRFCFGFRKRLTTIFILLVFILGMPTNAAMRLYGCGL